MTCAHQVELPVRQVTLGARFKPAMAARFLRVGATEIVDRTIELSDFWSSRRTRYLAERIADAKTPEEGAAQIETALGEAPALDAPENAIAQLVESRGIVSLDDLADAAQSTAVPKNLPGADGISPKRLARILHFRNAVAQATPGRRGDWAEVALECGYHDQAHLINEFREFSGVAPGNFSTDLGPHTPSRPE